jgi:hypothetical protein
MAIGPDDWNWWWDAWKNRYRCSCRALIDVKGACPFCGFDYSNLEPIALEVDGKLIKVQQGVPGALDWSPLVMLQLMHRDWRRPLAEDDGLSPPGAGKPSSRLVLVLIFWTFFETLMGFLYETATSDLRPSVAEDLLNRYGSIGSRLDRLHRILFGVRYGDDLDQLGYAPIRQHLENVQRQRNAFIHGDAEAISEALVEETMKLFPSFQEAWIKTYNLRCARPSK